MFVTLLVAAQLSAPLRSEPVRLVREIQGEIDRTGGAALERVWRATLARRPHEPRALVAVSVFERRHYRHARVDSLLLVLEALPVVGAEWRAMGLIGRGTWRALGADVRAADSLLVAAREVARTVGARDVEAEAVGVLAQVRARTQGARTGLEVLDEWWALLAAPTPDDSANRVCLREVMREQLGQPGNWDAMESVAEGAARRRSWRVAGNCLLSLAQLVERRGYSEGARGFARKSLAAFRRIDNAIGVALAAQWYGYLNVVTKNFAEGRALLEEAVAGAKRTGFESVEAWAYSGLAELYLAVGDHTRAREYAVRAATSHRARGDLWGLANARRFEASALLARGDLPGAAAAYEAAQVDFGRAGLPGYALPSLVGRINALVRQGLLDSAERLVGEGDVVGRSTPSWLRVESPVLRGVIALKRGQAAEAAALFRSSPVARAWRADSSGVPGGVVLAVREAQAALRLGRLAVADSALQFTMSRLEQWRGEGGTFSDAVAQLARTWGGLAEVYPDLVHQLVLRDRVGTALELVERIRAREIVERRLQAVALDGDTARVARALHRVGRQRATVTLAELQQTLGPREAFVSYVMGVDDAPTTAIVVTPQEVHAHLMPTGAALKPDITRFLQLAASGTDPTAVSRRLGNALLTPVLAGLPAGTTRLLVSPDGDIQRLPLDALQLADGKYALERVTMSVTPSATALLALRATSRVRSNTLVAIGDPQYSSATARPAETIERSPLAGSAFPRLPFSRDEARRIARFGSPGATRLGGQATVAAVDSALRNAAVVHIAAHGLVDDESEFHTGLALTPSGRDDGFLTPGELAATPVAGALVVLSACRSSGGVLLGGEGLRGLTGPLLSSGARAVVGTSWSIGDRSTVPFIERFYATMAKGIPPDEALRQVKLAAIRAGVNVADWASFSVTGDASLTVPLRPSAATLTPWVRRTATSSR